MAKYKPARGKPKSAGPKPGAWPCLLIIVLGIALISLMFYLSLKSASQ